MQVPRSV